MNITSGALKRLAHVVLACALVQIALRADAAMAEAADAARAQALLGACPLYAVALRDKWPAGRLR